jgi:hypothetical protein
MRNISTQTHIDINTARDLAAELGLDCTIEGDDDGLTITMDTGEVEPAAGLPRALHIIRSYAALIPPARVGGRQMNRLIGVHSQLLPPPDDPTADIEDYRQTWVNARLRTVHRQRARKLRRRGEQVVDTGERTRTGRKVSMWFVAHPDRDPGEYQP